MKWPYFVVENLTGAERLWRREFVRNSLKKIAKNTCFSGAYVVSCISVIRYAMKREVAVLDDGLISAEYVRKTGD